MKRNDGKSLLEGTTAVVGPAGAGKTELLLDHWRRRPLGGPQSQVWWIVPSSLAGQALRHRLAADSTTGIVSSAVLTFEELAERIISSSAKPLVPVSTYGRRQLLRALVEQAIAREQLEYLEPIAGQPGLLDLLESMIDELERVGARPQQFAAAAGVEGLASAKDRDLSKLYRLYRTTLERNHLYDCQDALWHARELMLAGESPGLKHVEAVCVDGFSRLTCPQRELLAAMVKNGKSLAITLPLEPETPRELFAASARELDELRQLFPRINVRWLERAPLLHRPALAHVEKQLFKNPRELRGLQEFAGLEVVASGSQLAELEWVARRTKRLLIDGDPDLQTPVRPGEIAVVIRPLEDSADLVREVFAEFGIPVSIGEPQPLRRNPRLRLLLSLVELQLEDWPFRKLLGVLGNQLLEGLWSRWGGADAAGAAELTVRDFQIPQGRTDLLEAANRWASRPTGDTSRARTLETSRRARLALPILEGLGALLDALPVQATYSEWAQALKHLAGETGLLEPATGKGRSPDLEREAWRRLESALSSEDTVQSWTGTAEPHVTLAALYPKLVDVLQHQPLPCCDDAAGRVRVLDAADAAHLSVPYLFFCGLSERSFPAFEQRDRFHGESETARLNLGGVPLPTRAERQSAEMQLFYQVVTRATRRLWLSYPALDAKAQPLSPSPYLLEVERACGGLTRHSEIHLSPVPRSEPLCARDLRISAVVAAEAGEPELLAGLVRQHATGVAQGILAALRMAHDRQTGSAFGPFEGICSGSKAEGIFAERFGPSKTWSPSQLEQYAHCPYQFFLQRVLGLEALEDPALEVNYALRGRLVHDVLARLHRQLNEEGGPTSPCAADPADIERLAMSILESLQDSLRNDRPLERAMRELDRRLLRNWLIEYQNQHRQYEAQCGKSGPKLLPTYFEVSFGPPPGSENEEGDDESSARPSTRAPFVLDCGSESIRLAGRIDRIDVGQIGDRTVFNIIDYKTGSTPLTRKAVSDGKLLQLPLYAMAVEELLLAPEAAVPWSAGYWYLKAKGHTSLLSFYAQDGQMLSPTEEWDALRRQLLDQVRSLVWGVRQGHFPMQSADLQCTSRCDFRTVCRVGQVRALEKHWPPEVVENPE